MWCQWPEQGFTNECEELTLHCQTFSSKALLALAQLRARLDSRPAPHSFLPSRTIGDRMGEAKASGNLGNTLKVLGRFDEAIVCCQRHLDIAQEQGDKVGGWPPGSYALPIPAETLNLRH